MCVLQMDYNRRGSSIKKGEAGAVDRKRKKAHLPVTMATCPSKRSVSVILESVVFWSVV